MRSTPEDTGDRVSAGDSAGTTPADDARPCDEYDEPWEWSVGARLSSSLQVSPSSPGALSLDTEENTYSEPAGSESLLSDSESYDEDMTTRQRRMLYETAFDSRVKRDIDDIDRLMQSPVLQGDLFRPRDAQVVRTASRSSFGSTSGSSNSSTPTHQPSVVHTRNSPRNIPRHIPLHFTPTERRKVTLIRELPRSSSPQAQRFNALNSVEPLHKGFDLNGSSRLDNRVICNFGTERKLSLTNNWDTTRSSERSSSQESMNVVEEHRIFPLGKSASRDSIDDRRFFPIYSNEPKVVMNVGLGSNGFAKNTHDENISEGSPFSSKKAIHGHPGVKVLPTDNGKLLAKARNRITPTSIEPNPTFKTLTDQVPSGKICPPAESCQPSSKVNESRSDRLPRPCSLITESGVPNKYDQSPENDGRPLGDYDPPWDFKSHGALRPTVNGSKSVPESLSHQPLENFQNVNSIIPNTSTNMPDRMEETSTKSSGLQSLSSFSGSTSNTTTTAATTSTTTSNANEEVKQPPPKPSGPPARPTLNLNLNLNSNSPKKARQNLTLNFGCSALSAVGEKVDADLTLEKQGWYHGSISRLDAENLLRVLKEGSYLVRNSESSKQDYSLSLKSARGFMHMKIVHSDGRFILGQFSKPFSSIPEMIHHYSINKLPIKGAEHMSLLYPVIDQLL